MANVEMIDRARTSDRLQHARELTHAALLAATSAGASSEVLDLLLDALRVLSGDDASDPALRDS